MATEILHHARNIFLSIKAIKIKLTQTVLERHFTIRHKERFYYVSCLNSDKPILGLINRDTWEILDEELEELCTCEFQDATKKEKEQVRKNRILANRLIDFCIRHFNDYKLKIQNI